MYYILFQSKNILKIFQLKIKYNTWHIICLLINRIENEIININKQLSNYYHYA